MLRIASVLIVLGLMVVPALAGDWLLSDNLDKTLIYTSSTYEEFLLQGERYTSPRGGLVFATATQTKNGALRPYAKGMQVKGEARPGQMLVAGAALGKDTCVEFVVTDGSRLSFQYGLCDEAVKAKNEGTQVTIELIAGGKTAQQEISLTKNQWSEQTVALPKPGPVLVRLTAKRLGFGNYNWTALVVKGDGALEPLDKVRALSPAGAKVRVARAQLKPSPYRVTVKPGYDILFYRDQPFLSYAAKGHPAGAHAIQAEAGINTYYQEGLSFAPWWPANTPAPSLGETSSVKLDLQLCQQYNMPFKTAMSMAHCTPFLPPWLVEKEKLGFTGHKMRRGGPTHASIFRAKTLQWHEAGVKGWVDAFKDQPVIFVFGQEEVPEDLDDYGDEAAASWRAWLSKRFHGDFKAFSAYVGGVKGVSTFDAAPYLKRFQPAAGAGMPMRLAWLKFLWLQDTYGDYLEKIFAYTRSVAPGVPVTQRYVYSPCGVQASRRAKSDYNYTFGHLSVEGVPNGPGVGMKPWSGLFAHAGTLPFPRGCSIGKTYDRVVRRGPITEAEWRLNMWVALADGMTGFEYQPFFAVWGEGWAGAALATAAGALNDTGRVSAKVMGEAIGYSKHMMKYDRYEDVAVFHDAAFNAQDIGGRYSQSKVGLYTLIRETGFHPAVLTAWDMTAQNLKGRKVLVLGGSTAIAPEIQDAIRAYVRDGGTLVTVFCADGAGFPGCNSYGHAAPLRDSAQTQSFGSGGDKTHLGDVLGVVQASGRAARKTITMPQLKPASLDAFNKLVQEKKWVETPPCVQTLALAPEAKVLATFDDGSPAVFERAFGKGRAITFAFDMGVIANNLTLDPLYSLWSQTLSGLGCRKALDTKNWRVFGGAWRDDDGVRVVFLTNLDKASPQTAALPNGRTVTLAPGATHTEVIKP